jgi:hypothetical protein
MRKPRAEMAWNGLVEVRRRQFVLAWSMQEYVQGPQTGEGWDQDGS